MTGAHLVVEFFGGDLLVEPSPGHPLNTEEWLYGQVQVTQNGPVFLRLLGAHEWCSLCLLLSDMAG